uniref:Bradykinin-potentiating peptide K12 n=1 Tax=Buthus occitanus TaxID=6868 RepID=NDB12_BUTOI|nr:RecName: Full=Bradykinin-potentiating peptide K12; Short=BPP-K12; Short=Peptide K-12; AltName: Full=Non-disulfide-bridged peptide 1.2; Short=NDBP-1.2 [Buthus occitanus]AAB49496.1 peptide K12=bradykinin-potentiating peptide/BPP [Buthus occitanus, venom, Peptide, 21 aa] [Buthus occitanus]
LRDYANRVINGGPVEAAGPPA